MGWITSGFVVSEILKQQGVANAEQNRVPRIGFPLVIGFSGTVKDFYAGIIDKVGRYDCGLTIDWYWEPIGRLSAPGEEGAVLGLEVSDGVLCGWVLATKRSQLLQVSLRFGPAAEEYRLAFLGLALPNASERDLSRFEMLLNLMTTAVESVINEIKASTEDCLET